jgi:ABC-type transport system involved in Fe-S cluster assembly fused permease/ATPase subunit
MSATPPLRSLRRQIGIVTQDSVIFPGTIADNIAYAMPNTARADRRRRRAGVLREFILQKPQLADTPLDGLGGQLSGGQKQRLNIARARSCRKSPILILDEASARSMPRASTFHRIVEADASATSPSPPLQRSCPTDDPVMDKGHRRCGRSAPPDA